MLQDLLAQIHLSQAQLDQLGPQVQTAKLLAPRDRLDPQVRKARILSLQDRQVRLDRQDRSLTLLVLQAQRVLTPM